jgi:FkbM family methyltransferase
MNFEEFKNKLNYDHYRTLEKTKSIYIFGAGNFAKDIAELLLNEGYNILGFVVSYKNIKTLLNLPVYEFNELTNKDATMVLGVYSHNVTYVKILEEIKKNYNCDPFMPWELYDQFSDKLGWRYWLSKKNFLEQNIDNIKQAVELYHDEESKNCLLNALLFRFGLNPSYAEYRSVGTHYFNSLSIDKFKDKSVKLVDGGAFTGDTYKLASRLLDISMAFLFEPDPKNFNTLKKTVGKNAVCYPLALAEKSKVLKFKSDIGPSSVVDNNGDLVITATSLDILLSNSTVDIIKLDIEGSESDALNGARKLIKSSRPVIVSAAYHKPGDLWNLVFLLNDICVDYNFYLRQHDHNSFETVIYAIPN